jgi:hypothetical protein
MAAFYRSIVDAMPPPIPSSEILRTARLMRSIFELYSEGEWTEVLASTSPRAAADDSRILTEETSRAGRPACLSWVGFKITRRRRPRSRSRRYERMWILIWRIARFGAVENIAARNDHGRRK